MGSKKTKKQNKKILIEEPDTREDDKLENMFEGNVSEIKDRLKIIIKDDLIPKEELIWQKILRCSGLEESSNEETQKTLKMDSSTEEERERIELRMTVMVGKICSMIDSLLDSRKSPVLEYLLKLVDNIFTQLNTLILSEDVSVRLRGLKVTLLLLSEIVRHHDILESSPFRTPLFSLLRNLTPSALAHPNREIQSSIVTFMSKLIEENILAEEILDDQKVGLLSFVLANIGKEDSTIRGQLIKLLKSSFESLAIKQKKILTQITAKHQGLLQACLDGTPREVCQLLLIATSMLDLLIDLPEQAVNSYLIFIFHRSKEVSEAAMEILIKRVKKLIREPDDHDAGYSDDFILAFITKIGELVDLSKAKGHLRDEEYFGEMVSSQPGFQKSRKRILELSTKLIGPNVVKKRNNRDSERLLKLLHGIVKSISDEEKNLLGLDIHRDLDHYLEAFSKSPSSQLLLLKIYKFITEQTILTEPENELKVKLFSKLFLSTPSLDLAALLIQLIKRSLLSSQATARELDELYNTMQVQVDGIGPLGQANLEGIINTEKAAIVSSALLSRRSIAVDFFDLKGLLSREESLRGEVPVGCLRASMSIGLSSFKAIMLNLAEPGGEVEVKVSKYRQARSQLINQLEQFMEFEPTFLAMKRIEIEEVRQLAYSTLCEIYELTSSDKVQALSFLYLFPTFDNLERIMTFVKKAITSVKNINENERTDKLDSTQQNATLEPSLDNKTFIISIVGCSLKLLQNCSKSFGGTFGGNLVFELLKALSSCDEASLLLENFFKLELEKDIEARGRYFFLNYLSSIVLEYGKFSPELQSVMSMMTSIMSSQQRKGKSNPEVAEFLSKCSLICVSILVDEGCSDDDKNYILEIVARCLLKKSIFKGSEEKLKLLLLKVYHKRQELGNRRDEKVNGLEAVENGLLKLLGLDRKPTLQESTKQSNVKTRNANVSSSHSESETASQDKPRTRRAQFAKIPRSSNKKTASEEIGIPTKAKKRDTNKQSKSKSRVRAPRGKVKPL